MGKLKYFDINYDHPNAVYMPGDVVCGQVHLLLSEPKKIKHLQLWCQGRGVVYWKDTDHSTGITSHYRAHEVYFENTIVLVQSSGDSKVQLQAGEHKFPFEIRLANDLPSSFEGVYGYVRYLCTAKLEHSWHGDYDTEKAFTVISHLDLNNEPTQLKTVMEGRDSVQVKYCGCYSGPVTADFRINRRGFVPGECVIVNAKVVNGSNLVVKSTKVSIQQCAEFLAISDSSLSTGEIESKVESFCVASIEGEGIMPGGCDDWVDVPIQVPALPPSRLDGCNIINIAYVIEFEVIINKHTGMKLECSIVIGTIPLREAVAESLSTTVSSGAAAKCAEAAATLTPGHESMQHVELPTPPPSYEESMRGAVFFAESEKAHEEKWAPSYPVYRQLSAKQKGRTPQS